MWVGESLTSPMLCPETPGMSHDGVEMWEGWTHRFHESTFSVCNGAHMPADEYKGAQLILTDESPLRTKSHRFGRHGGEGVGCGQIYDQGSNTEEANNNFDHCTGTSTQNKADLFVTGYLNYYYSTNVNPLSICSTLTSRPMPTFALTTGTIDLNYSSYTTSGSNLTMTSTSNTSCYGTWLSPMMNGIEMSEKKSFKYLPIPFRNEFTIKGDLKNSHIEVYDVLGKKVYYNDRVTSDNFSIDTHTWNSGTYYIRINTPKNNLSNKVIVKY